MFNLFFAHASTFTPVQGTDIARQVDQIYGFLIIASVISFIILIGGMIVFVLKYRRKSFEDKTPYITHNNTLEFLWSFIPFVIFMVVGVWGAIVYYDMRRMPEDALEVHVFAKKWDWRFVYKNGKEVTNETDAEGNTNFATMVVPLNKPVRLIMTSQEQATNPVLHSFYIPAFRIKQDLVPGRFTQLQFTANKKGNFYVFCAEYCGAGHSKMMARIRVVEQEEFEKWLSTSESSEGMSLADLGRKLYSSKACMGCHSVNGTRLVGPSFKGLWGKDRQFQDGSSTKADENYIRNSVLNPNSQVVAGYAPQMPTYKGQLSEEQIGQLVEFIKSLAD